jgi:hypothetical protein
MKAKVLEMTLFHAIQETIAGFINDQVLSFGAEFYYDENMPETENENESLYDQL